MSTSAEYALPDGAAVRLRSLAYADPLAQHLVERVQQEYVVRYGGRDEAAVDPSDFALPGGLFVVAEVDGEPAGCGAWRQVGEGRAEIKRMYVEPAFRRRGLAALVLDVLERSAGAHGCRAVVLNSGDKQPEALALYDRAGYVPAPGYGVYACAPGAVFLGKQLPSAGSDPLAGVPVDPEEQSWAS